MFVLTSVVFELTNYDFGYEEAIFVAFQIKIWLEKQGQQFLVSQTLFLYFLTVQKLLSGFIENPQIQNEESDLHKKAAQDVLDNLKQYVYRFLFFQRESTIVQQIKSCRSK